MKFFTFQIRDVGGMDGWKTSVRDKVAQQEQWEKEGLVFHTTNDIIKVIEKGRSQNGVEVPSKTIFLIQLLTMNVISNRIHY